MDCQFYIIYCNRLTQTGFIIINKFVLFYVEIFICSVDITAKTSYKHIFAKCAVHAHFHMLTTSARQNNKPTQATCFHSLARSLSLACTHLSISGWHAYLGHLYAHYYLRLTNVQLLFNTCISSNVFFN